MALYLKYRPKDFDNLIWQDFINNTLKEAIKNNKTVWAYLLCGPRWTWKTSTARILAKATNCLNLKNWNPCNDCWICNWINNESLVDVIEIDAASNTWVDNIREIITKAQFRPTIAKFKIYIIDEVHMLSKWAFNALLKILEEPPEYVKFILATTETHKVPETILSRCQRYDFKSINSKDLTSRLNYIAEQEWIKVEDNAINYIVQNSWWGARNAISLFEQLIENGELTYEKILSKLWLEDNEKLSIFLDKLINKDNTIIDMFDDIISNWKNIKLFFKDLIFFTKQKALDSLKLNKNISELINILETLDSIYSKTKNSLDENTTFMIWILKIINKYSQTPTIETKKIAEINSKPKIEVKGKKISTQKKSKEDIKIDDVSDIFWESEVKKDKFSSENNSIKKEDSSQNSSIFNKKELIKNLKEIWVKWWLTMWILWAEVFKQWNNLEITYKTSFALKQANTTENISLINQALEKMNENNLNIILK